MAATRAWRSIAHASGIAEIETLKRTVHSLQAALDAAALRRSAALASHDSLTAESATAYRGLTSLMQRRDAWEAADVARFTDLTTREYTLARSIEAALTERAAAGRGAETAQRAFVGAMHERYRAEHLFGEKTRLLSTYAWFTLTGVNIGLFLLGQFLVVERREAKRSEMLNAVAATAAAAAVERESEPPSPLSPPSPPSSLSAPSLPSPPWMRSAHRAPPRHGRCHRGRCGRCGRGRCSIARRGRLRRRAIHSTRRGYLFTHRDCSLTAPVDHEAATMPRPHSSQAGASLLLELRAVVAMGEEVGSKTPVALAPPLPPPSPPLLLRITGVAGAPLSQRWRGLLAAWPRAPRWLISIPHWPEQLAEPRLACAVGVVGGVLGTGVCQMFVAPCGEPLSGRPADR